MKQFWLAISITTLLGNIALAQQPDTLRFTLKEAIDYALINNPQLKSAEMNESNNEFKVKEVKAMALPQISGTLGGTDNFQLGSQLLPGELMGQPGTTIPVKFGTRFIYSGNVKLSQTLYDPSLKSGLKAARESQGLYELQTLQSKEDLVYNMANLFVQIQLVEKQIELYEGNISRIERLLEITNLQLKEGIVKKVDVTQIQVSLTNMKTQLSNSENDHEKLEDNLKLLMNLDIAQPIAISSPVSSEKVTISRQLDLGANTELQLIDKQMQLQDLNTESIKAGYKPTLGFSASYGRQWQTNEMFKGGSTTGFSSGYYGLNLSIPIFDGFKKRNQISQSKIATQQLKLNKEYTAQNIQTQFRTASNKLNQNQQVFKAQSQNMKLAEELYNVAKLSYTEGISDLSELINAENSLREAQSQYLTAMLQTNLAELETMKASGQLSQLIKGYSPGK